MAVFDRVKFVDVLEKAGVFTSAQVIALADALEAAMNVPYAKQNQVVTGPSLPYKPERLQ